MILTQIITLFYIIAEYLPKDALSRFCDILSESFYSGYFSKCNLCTVTSCVFAINE